MGSRSHHRFSQRVGHLKVTPGSQTSIRVWSRFVTRASPMRPCLSIAEQRVFAPVIARIKPDKVILAVLIAALLAAASTAIVFCCYRASLPLEIDPNEAWNAWQSKSLARALPGSRRTHGEQLSPTLLLSAPCLLFTWRRGNLRWRSHLHSRFACSDVSCLSRDPNPGRRAIGGLYRGIGFWPCSREPTPAMSA